MHESLVIISHFEGDGEDKEMYASGLSGYSGREPRFKRPSTSDLSNGKLFITIAHNISGFNES